MKKIISILILFFCMISFQSRADDIIDLSYSFNHQTIYWPTNDGFKLKKHGWKINEDGYFYAGNDFCAPEHGGTHIDAPIHFSKNKWTVDQIPIDHLFGNAVVIHLQDKIKNNSDYLISKNDITEWEKKFRIINSNDIVLFYTGWSRFWPNKKKYLGSSKKRDVSHLKFPGLSIEASKYLVFKKIKGVGLDVASLDYGLSKDFMSHRILLKANIFGLENVAQLDKLTPTGYQLIVAPMKIADGTGGPVRIFAQKIKQ